MIPKIIHYCWFGGKPLPESVKKCIASWHKFLPDYEIKEWNESNFDVNIIPYTQEAYSAKKYAFVSDYARFWILYKYGGIYFDTDVEVIRNMDDIIARGPFMGCQNKVKSGTILEIAPGLGIGVTPHLRIVKELLNMYQHLLFYNDNKTINLKTVVDYTTGLLQRDGLQEINKVQKIDDIFIYTQDFFSPIDLETRKLNITENTVSIHHFTASWVPREQIWEDSFWRWLYKWFGIKPHRFMWHLDNFIDRIKASFLR